MSYVSGTYDTPDGFIKLNEKIEELEKAHGGEKRSVIAHPPSLPVPPAPGVQQFPLLVDFSNGSILRSVHKNGVTYCHGNHLYLVNQLQLKTLFFKIL